MLPPFISECFSLLSPLSSDRADSRCTRSDRAPHFTSISNSSISLHRSLSPPLPPVRVLLLHSGLIYLFCPSQRCSLPPHRSVCIIFPISSRDAPLELSNLLSAELWDVRGEVRPVTLVASSLPFTFDSETKQTKTLLTFSLVCINSIVASLSACHSSLFSYKQLSFTKGIFSASVTTSKS